MANRRWTYFVEREVENMDEEFVSLLDRARHISKVPYIIISGYRSDDHNQEVGGVPESSHTRGTGADLKADNSFTRYRILKGLIAVGICRIGIYKNHCHADVDLDKPQGVIWIGDYKK